MEEDKKKSKEENKFVLFGKTTDESTVKRTKKEVSEIATAAKYGIGITIATIIGALVSGC
jgi:hypothetical protein